MATKKKLVTRYIAFNRDIFEDAENGSCVFDERGLSEIKNDYDFYIEVKGPNEEEEIPPSKKLGTFTVK